jgi:hypothetical protein
MELIKDMEVDVVSLLVALHAIVSVLFLDCISRSGSSKRIVSDLSTRSRKVEPTVLLVTVHRFVYGNRDLTRRMAEELGYVRMSDVEIRRQDSLIDLCLRSMSI